MVTGEAHASLKDPRDFVSLCIRSSEGSRKRSEPLALRALRRAEEKMRHEEMD